MKSVLNKKINYKFKILNFMSKNDKLHGAASIFKFVLSPPSKFELSNIADNISEINYNFSFLLSNTESSKILIFENFLIFLF